MKRSFTLLFLFIHVSLNAQNFSKEKLLATEYEDLLVLFNEVADDSIKAERVALAYLEKARKENDTIKMARGYDRLARIFHAEKNIIFADSLIELTKNFKDKTYPALGYIIKSYEYQRIGDLILKTENALKAYELALKNENFSQQIYISDYLIYTKSIWGNKEEALLLQRKRHKLMNEHDYFSKIKESTRQGIKQDLYDIHLGNELSSILNFVFCHLNLKNLDSASIYNNLGISKLEIYNGPQKKYYQEWFQECSVEINYYSGNFSKAITTVNELLKNPRNTLQKSSLLNLYYFKGHSFIELGEYEVGIGYLNSADSIFEVEKVPLQPYQRKLFETLLEYHNVKNNSKKKIKYLNKLLYLDSIFKINYQFFDPDLIKNFETPKLLKEKQELIDSLENINQKSKVGLWLGFCVLIICLYLVGHYFKKQSKYKKRFDTLMLQNSQRIQESTPPNKIEISTEIFNGIINNLIEFENGKKYLSKKISLIELAHVFKTNSRYLSFVINLEKGQSFPQYINDLRVGFALKELAINPRFRKFTIKAIASDCGFKSAESFSKAFFKRHGIYPSYYIKKLENLSDD